MALLVGSLVQLDQSDQNGQPDAGQPALGSTTRHLLQFKARQELDLNQHGKVIKEPIAHEGETS